MSDEPFAVDSAHQLETKVPTTSIVGKLRESAAPAKHYERCQESVSAKINECKRANDCCLQLRPLASA